MKLRSVMSFAPRAALLVVVVVAFVAACGPYDPVVPADAGTEDDAGSVDDNPCGGDGALSFEGEAARPGDDCGECDHGVLVCDEADALRCRGAKGANECGGCEVLVAEEGAGCGPCGQGTYHCGEDGGLECVGAAEPNGCGGCGDLDGSPGTQCSDEGTSGVFRCASDEEVRCATPDQNACGGTSSLDTRPGTPCGACNRGVVVCEGTDDVDCQGDDEGVNACGGCTPLRGEPEEACGVCDGEWYCGAEDVAVCDDARNGCGGCAELQGEPGQACDDDGAVWVCEGPDEVYCPDEPTNGCGGEATLEAEPGAACGECEDGVVVCASPEETVCMGATEPNACGGCGLLPGQEDQSCGAGATWECTEDGSMRCEVDDQFNACGGTESLEATLGEACGPCDLDVYVCDGDDQVVCSGSTPCPASVTTLEAQDVAEESVRLRGRLDEAPDPEIAKIGFCWHTSQPADDGTCQQVGMVDEAEEFELFVDGELNPGTDYFFHAYAETDDTVVDRGEDREFVTVPPRPTGMSATEGDSTEHVLVEWEATPGADAYELYRYDADGANPTNIEQVTDDGSGSYTVPDDNADPSPTPGPPPTTGVVETTDHVEVQWDPAVAEKGTEHPYEVVAVNESGASDGAVDDGWRGVRPVDTYEVRSSLDQNDWTDWDEVTSPDERYHRDETVPRGSITTGVATASEATHPDHVRLQTDEADVQDAADVYFEIRATNETGPGEASAVSGAREVGDAVTYDWEYSEDGDDYSEVADCDGTPTCQDGDATDDADNPYHYRVALSAAGADETPVYNDAGTGYRAVLDLAFGVSPSDPETAGEEFGVEVQLINQHDEAVELDGVGVEAAPNQHEFAPDVAPDASTDDTGLADIDGLVLETADDGYVLTATVFSDPFEQDLSEVTGTTDAFGVEAGKVSEDYSTISGEDGAVADGTDNAEITIELFDVYENPVEGRTPTFYADPDDGNTYGDCSETDPQGVATCQMSSTEPGVKTLWIDEPVNVEGDTIEFERTCGADLFAGGEGTSGEPYQLSSADHLNAVGAHSDCLGRHFLVIDDIDLAGIDYNVIGDVEDFHEDRFGGTFDGDDHVVSNLTIDESDRDYVGLFGFVGDDGLIENVGVEDVELTGAKYVGGLVGRNGGGEILNTYATGTVTGAESEIGGLVGYNSAGTVAESNASAKVSGDTRVGGLVGYNPDGTITESSVSGDVSGEISVGGLVGYNYGGTITSSHTTGTVTAEDWFGGGLVGVNSQGTIEESYASGQVSGDDSLDVVGGFVGRNYRGQITDAYATGGVEGGEQVGGFAGLNVGSSFAPAIIENAYAAGPVSGDSEVGGFIGDNEGDDGQEIDSSFWDTQTSGEDDGFGSGEADVTGLETEEFGDETEFADAGWDFDEIWTIGTAPDGEERPVVQWQDE